jgi:hypothetical protein
MRFKIHSPLLQARFSVSAPLPMPPRETVMVGIYSPTRDHPAPTATTRAPGTTSNRLLPYYSSGYWVPRRRCAIAIAANTMAEVPLLPDVRLSALW